MEDIRAANPRNHNHFGYLSEVAAIELATFLFRRCWSGGLPDFTQESAQRRTQGL
jgi:hypothetical protein